MKKAILVILMLASVTTMAQTKGQMVGCWKMPAIKGENLLLNADGSFSFDDFNALTKATENFYGTWKLARNKVTLMYDDRPQQNFTLHKDKNGKWILKKEGGFTFVKKTTAECEAGK